MALLLLYYVRCKHLCEDDTSDSDPNSEIFGTFSPLEKHLSKTQKVVDLRNKVSQLLHALTHESSGLAKIMTFLKVMIFLIFLI